MTEYTTKTSPPIRVTYRKTVRIGDRESEVEIEVEGADQMASTEIVAQLIVDHRESDETDD